MLEVKHSTKVLQKFKTGELVLYKKSNRLYKVTQVNDKSNITIETVQSIRNKKSFTIDNLSVKRLHCQIGDSVIYKDTIFKIDSISSEKDSMGDYKLIARAKSESDNSKAVFIGINKIVHV